PRSQRRLNHTLLDRARRPGGGLAKQYYSRQRYYALTPASNPAPLSRIVLLGQSPARPTRSEEHTSEIQSRFELVCRLLLEKKKSLRVQDTPDHQKIRAHRCNFPHYCHRNFTQPDTPSLTA